MFVYTYFTFPDRHSEENIVQCNCCSIETYVSQKKLFQKYILQLSRYRFGLTSCLRRCISQELSRLSLENPGSELSTNRGQDPKLKSWACIFVGMVSYITRGSTEPQGLWS